jgi:hypothetical protein
VTKEQLQLVRKAYQDGFSAAMSNFKDQQRHLRRQAEGNMDELLKLYDVGTKLKLFEKDDEFTRDLEVVRRRFLALARFTPEGLHPRDLQLNFFEDVGSSSWRTSHHVGDSDDGEDYDVVTDG